LVEIEVLVHYFTQFSPYSYVVHSFSTNIIIPYHGHQT